MNFLVKYLCVAVLGSLAVYWVAPLLPKETRPTGRPLPAEHAEPVSIVQEIEPVEQMPSSVPVARKSLPDEPADEAGRYPSPPPVPSSRTMPEVDRETQAAPAMATETIRGYTPSTERIRPSGTGVQFWGVTLKEAALFEPTGKRRDERLPGGTLIEQVGSVKSSKGEMARLRVWRGSAWAGPYLVSTSDLIRFEGGREEVDADGVTDLCTYFALSDRLEGRKEALREQAASKNPHYAELKALATRYNDNVGRAKRLTKERDQAKGARRAQLADDLRKLEIVNKKLEIKVKELTSKYEAWKKSHGVETVVFDSDPQIRLISEKMAEIKPRLALFGI